MVRKDVSLEIDYHALKDFEEQSEKWRFALDAVVAYYDDVVDRGIGAPKKRVRPLPNFVHLWELDELHLGLGLGLVTYTFSCRYSEVLKYPVGIMPMDPLSPMFWEYVEKGIGIASVKDGDINPKTVFSRDDLKDRPCFVILNHQPEWRRIVANETARNFVFVVKPEA